MRSLCLIACCTMIAACSTSSAAQRPAKQINHYCVGTEQHVIEQPELVIDADDVSVFAPPVPEVEFVETKRNVLIVGDSEACAVAPHVKHVRGVNDVTSTYCKGATVVQQWSHVLFRSALRSFPKPDVIVVFLGTNHYWQQETPPVEPLLKQIRSTGAACVWVGNTAVKGKKWKVNELIRNAVSNTCTYYDTEAANIRLFDGVHPDPVAARGWLESVWRILPIKYEVTNEQ